jgi:hypothetical protein
MVHFLISHIVLPFEVPFFLISIFLGRICHSDVGSEVLFGLDMIGGDRVFGGLGQAGVIGILPEVRCLGR